MFVYPIKLTLYLRLVTQDVQNYSGTQPHMYWDTGTLHNEVKSTNTNIIERHIGHHLNHLNLLNADENQIST